ncbi:hypothetical protein ACT4S5_13110 [Kocuria oceani]|uniref:hypothetical protein n=1 Tax=Kocuria oceani TaxID=988827 RepID=UPI004035FA49
MATTTVRTITRIACALVVVALLATAVSLGEIELITAALVAGVVGIAMDVRQTKKLSRVRRRP